MIKKLRQFYASHRIAILKTVRFVCFALQVAALIFDTWGHYVGSIVISSSGIAVTVAGMIWSPPKGGWWFRRRDNDDDPSNGPDNPTGDSVERWLQARTRAKV